MKAGLLFLGVLIAVLKIAIEYSSYKRNKKEFRFHFIGSACVFSVLLIVYYLTECNWQMVLLTALAYWNTFEILGNYSHNQPLLYVGEYASFDKGIRWLTKTKFFRFLHTDESRFKFMLHLAAITIILILL
jgi:uncharacterized membrane protein